MMTLISFYWKPIGIILLSLMIISYVDFLKHERNKSQKEVIELSQQNTIIKNDIDLLNKQIIIWQELVKQQNDKINNMNIAYEQMSKRVELAKQKIQQLNIENAARLEALDKYYQSIPDSNTCDDIKRILDANVPTLH